MTEYWLQKKTIGGWSHVTWYASELEALKQMKACVGAGNSGYSWRVVKTETLKEALLQDHVEPEPIKPDVLILKSSSGWGEEPKTILIAAEPHGLAGKIWLVHHSLKQKKRVDPAEVDAMIGQGWERGGPKTTFRESKGGW